MNSLLSWAKNIVFNPTYTKIKTGTQEAGKKQMVFAILYCDDAKPYKAYQGTSLSDEEKESVIPMALMQMRWDGKIGFPGGKVEEGEELRAALDRELYEETSACISKGFDCIPLSTYSTPAMNIHSFAVKVSYRDLKDVIECSLDAEHFGAENGGCFLVHLASYKDYKGFDNFVRHNFCATAGMELVDLAEEYNLLKDFK